MYLSRIQWRVKCRLTVWSKGKKDTNMSRYAIREEIPHLAEIEILMLSHQFIQNPTQSRPTIQKVELSDFNSLVVQPVKLPLTKRILEWSQQLFDDRTPKVEFLETPTDGLRKSRRIVEQVRTSNHIVNMSLMVDIIGSVSEPTLVEEAMFDPKWKEAMLSKYNSITKNDS